MSTATTTTTTSATPKTIHHDKENVAVDRAQTQWHAQLSYDVQFDDDDGRLR